MENRGSNNTMLLNFNDNEADDIIAAEALITLRSSDQYSESHGQPNLTVGFDTVLKLKNIATQTEERKIPIAITILSNIKNEDHLSSLTGISTFDGFYGLCDAVVHYKEYRLNKTDLILPDVNSRVLLTLMKLKLGITYTALSAIFGIDRSTCSRQFKNTLVVLRAILKPAIKWLPRSCIRNNIPACFASYWKTRVILDCTEIPVFTSKCLKCRNQTYSNYKKRHTLKFMVGISPSGFISFVSSIYGGKSSDKFIFNDSKLLELLEPEDEVMVDRGFFIDEECAAKQVKILRPAFMNPLESQLSSEDSEHSRFIASARVHIERCIERIKNFNILHEEVDYHSLLLIRDVVEVICGVVNFSAPILADDKF